MKALLHGSVLCSELNQLPDGAVELTVHPEEIPMKSRMRSA